MNQRREAIDRWAKYVRESNGGWKKIHTEFINAQFQKAYEVMEKLSETKEGREKIVEIYGIKNRGGYRKLLG